MSDDRYQLIDFGDGRKLESLAGYLVDRPSPAAVGVRTRARGPREIVAEHSVVGVAGTRAGGPWADVGSTFDAQTKCWLHHTPWPNDLTVDCGDFRMPLRPTPFGHIGLFPEQTPNWIWLARGTQSADVSHGLNLFGYTGASTMAMVAGGFTVVHVDAAKPSVQAARTAAVCNGWGNRPIRYIVDDAGKFAAREVRRKRKYHTIALDPPAYGHGPKGKSWRLGRDLWPLLESCLELLCPDEFRLLITGHSSEIDESEVCNYLGQSRFIRQYGDSSGLRTEAGRSQLKDTFGRSLDAGFYVRIESPGP